MLELDSPSPLLGLILAQVEEEDAVRRRQADVGTLAPVNAEIFRGAPAAAAGRAVAVAARFAILLGLGAAERHAGVGVPIADDGLALRQGLGQGRRRLPPVGAEQQVDRPVVEVGAGLEVPVDELADLGGPVWVVLPQRSTPSRRMKAPRGAAAAVAGGDALVPSMIMLVMGGMGCASKVGKEGFKFGALRQAKASRPFTCCRYM